MLLFFPLVIIVYLVVTGFLQRLYDIVGNCAGSDVVTVGLVENARLARFRGFVFHIFMGFAAIDILRRCPPAFSIFTAVIRIGICAPVFETAIAVLPISVCFS